MRRNKNTNTYTYYKKIYLFQQQRSQISVMSIASNSNKTYIVTYMQYAVWNNTNSLKNLKTLQKLNIRFKNPNCR